MLFQQCQLACLITQCFVEEIGMESALPFPPLGMLAGLLLPVPSYRPAMNVSPLQPPPFGGPSTSPFSGGFYSGGGNEWANRR